MPKYYLQKDWESARLLIGQAWGSNIADLTVVDPIERKPRGEKNWYLRVRCKCGLEYDVRKGHLVSSRAKRCYSCGRPGTKQTAIWEAIREGVIL